MKKNKELIHNEKKVKLNKKNYIIIIIPITLVIICISIIALYVFYYTNPSVQMKKHLEERNYICNNSTCTIDQDGIIYNFNYENMYLLVETDEYNLTISDKYPVLELKSEDLICTYEHNDYKIFTFVDKTFSYNKKCEKYIEEINKLIQFYKTIIEDSNIDVKNFEK